MPCASLQALNNMNLRANTSVSNPREAAAKRSSSCYREKGRARVSRGANTISILKVHKPSTLSGGIQWKLVLLSAASKLMTHLLLDLFTFARKEKMAPRKHYRMADGGGKLPVHTHLPEPGSGREESPANGCERRGMSPQRRFLCLRLAGGCSDLTRLMVQLMSWNLVRVRLTFLAPISSSSTQPPLHSNKTRRLSRTKKGQRVEQVPPSCAGAMQITDLKIILLATTTT